MILSPHLDDAALSCWHMLEGSGDVTIVNVFAGIPDPGVVGWWDRLTGAADSAERVRERLREDAEALRYVAASVVTLDLLDEQYRRTDATPAVAAAIADEVLSAATVYAPFAPFMSGDHELVRDAAYELRDDVHLYADHPHAGVFGLPEWVTKQRDHTGLDVDSAWRERMSEAGLDPDALRAAVHVLDDEMFERKLAAVRAYRTQVVALEREAPLEQLRWEVTWRR